MSEIECKQQDLQEPEDKSLVRLDSETCQNQSLELCTSEITDKNAHLPIQISNNEVKGVDKLLDNFNHQEENYSLSQELPLTLETIYRELKFLRKDVETLQTYPLKKLG